MIAAAGFVDTEARAADGQPMSAQVKATVGSCAPAAKGATLHLPLITWGGDIATIQANGAAATTEAGSLFAKEELSIKLARQDVFARQVESYLKCESPFLRGTMGMIHMAAEVAKNDPRTKINVIYQMTWSAGGDALVVKQGIQKPADLQGKTIAVQAYGPHVDYLGKILADAGLGFKDVKIKWVKDLTASDASPAAALRGADVDAAMVIIPDAKALTSGGAVGTGAEDSVKGAKILLSTKSANRIIADVIAVRADFLAANRETVGRLVRALINAQEETAAIFKNRATAKDAHKKLLTVSAKLLLDSEQATADADGLYADAEFVGLKGNQQFFGDAKYPRRVARLSEEIQSSLGAVGLASPGPVVEGVAWDFTSLMKGVVGTLGEDKTRFNKEEVARVVAKRQKQDAADGTLFSFEIFFKPNQNDFAADLYAADFKKAIDLAATYGGAVITVEGHSDPLNYINKKKAGASAMVLRQIQQSAKNLSLTRGNAVRDSLVAYAKTQGVTMDPSQFAVVGHGIDKPLTGRCGEDPCAPKTEKEWLNNMRVEFRIIQVEAEEAVFNPM